MKFDGILLCALFVCSRFLGDLGFRSFTTIGFGCCVCAFGALFVRSRFLGVLGFRSCATIGFGCCVCAFGALFVESGFLDSDLVSMCTIGFGAAVVK